MGGYNHTQGTEGDYHDLELVLECHREPVQGAQDGGDVAGLQ